MFFLFLNIEDVALTISEMKRNHNELRTDVNFISKIIREFFFTLSFVYTYSKIKLFEILK